MIVINDKGCSDKTVGIANSYQDPDVKYTIDDSTQCFDEHKYRFTNNSQNFASSINYTWDFGDSSTSTAFNAVKVYSFTGRKSVSLIGVDSRGCRDTFIEKLYTVPMPKAASIVNDGDQCDNSNLFILKTASTVPTGAGILSSAWNFGNGATALGDSVSYHYSSLTGAVTVVHTVTSSYGCSDTNQVKLKVFNGPLAKFTIDTVNNCLRGNTFGFTENSTVGDANKKSFTWSFDGFSPLSRLISTRFTQGFLTAGSQNIKLLVEDNNGCKDSITKSVIVQNHPEALISKIGADSCQDIASKFKVVDLNAPKPVSVSWLFSDNQTFSDSIITVNFASDGQKSARAIVTNSVGCKDTANKLFNVYKNPVANFNFTDSAVCLRGNEVEINQTTANTHGSLTTVSWNFGDGSPTTLNNASSFKKSYLTAGTYAVKMIYTNSLGCGDTLTKSVTILPMPKAQFAWVDSLQCRTGNGFTVVNQSKSNVLGHSLSYSWNFGDSNTSTLNTPSLSYVYDGTKSVRLAVNSSEGCKDTFTSQVVVYPQPIVGFTINDVDQCVNNDVFTFNDTSKVRAGGGTLSRLWNLADAGTANTIGVSRSYSSSGNRNIKLVVTTSNGCKDSVTKSITVFAKPETRFAKLNPDSCLNTTWNFRVRDAISTTMTSVAWTISGSSTYSDSLIQHNFSSNGTHTIGLIIGNSNGCFDTTSRQVRVFRNPVASYTVDDSAQCFAVNYFKFNVGSTSPNGLSLQHSWDFGDTSGSSALKPVKVYASIGRRSVYLKSTDTRGCADSFRQDIYVAPYPVSNFTINDSVQCENHNVYVFEDVSTILNGGGSLSSQWIYGDNAPTASGDSVSHNYASKTGYIKVQHKSISSYGCRDSSIQTIHVRKGPDAAIGLDTVLYCIRGNEFGATDLTKKGEGNKTQFTWNWGDGKVDVKLTPSRFTHNYASIGTYTIKLLVEDQYACIDSISKTTTVHPNPTAQFAIVDSVQCFNANSFSFVNQSASNTGNSTLTYAWTFGDGGSSTAVTPTHSYTTFGPRDLQLQVSNVFGCRDTFDSKARVYSLPTVKFTVNDSTQCENNQLYNFQDLSSIASTEGTISRAWNLGDGSTSSDATINYKYVGHDTVSVKLVQTSSFGCKDSLSKRVEILRKPQIRFAKIGADSCRNTPSKFKAWDTDVAKPLSVSWLFSDNQTFNDSIITASFAVEGQKSLRVIVGNSNGCTDTINRIFNVYENPHAGFFITDSALCFRGNEFEYNDTTSIKNGTVSQLIWDFGDGNSQTKSTNAAVYNRYADTGNYTVKLRITNSLGCGDTITRKLRVLPQPKAVFTHADSLQCRTNNSFAFNNKSVSNSPTTSLTYDWRFGDSTTSTSASPVKSYVYDGVKNLTLYVENGEGCRDTFTSKLEVYPQPIVGFTINDVDQCVNNDVFTFNDTSKVRAGGGTLSRLWNLADAGTANTIGVSRSYSSSGNRNIKLVVTTSNGCKDSVTKSITVFAKPETRFAKLNPDSCLNTTWNFRVRDAISTTMTSVAWTISGSSTYSDSLIQHNFSSNGTHTIGLIIGNSNGCFDTTSRQVRVFRNPVASYTVDDSAQCFAVNYFKFNVGSTSPNGLSLQHSWDFGDTSGSSALKPVKVYASIGRRSVYLKSTDTRGCADSFRQDIYVAPYPVSNFTINDSVQCENHNVYVFEDVSTILNGGGSLSSQWIYGDNAPTASGDSVSHNYASKTGYIKVQHKSISSYGCRDSSIQTIHVRKGPDAAIGLDTVLYCIRGNEFGATDLTKKGEGNKTQFTWNWGDGKVDVKLTPSRFTHNYASIGTYTIKLLVEDQYACIDSISKTTTVHPNPTAQFAIVDSVQCFNANSFSFVNQSASNTGNSTLTYAWTFGDGGSSTAVTPTHSYTTFGPRDLQLQVSNVFGCRDTFDSKARVYSLPTVKFTVNDSTQCENNQLYNFQDLSSIASTEGTISRAWNLGDGSTSSDATINYKYVGHDTVSVKLVQTSSFGCKDSLSKRVEILRKPQIRFAKIGADSCRNTPSKFKAWDTDVAKPLSVSWLFSDNQTFNDSIITASFAVEGQKSLRVIVGNSNGCTDTINRIFNVYENPHAGFFITDSALCFRGNEFEYNDTTSIKNGTVSQLIWDFGDGNSQTKSTNAAVYNRYADTGNYTVKLRITNSLGCGDTITRKLRVLPQPKAVFTHADSLQCRTNNSFAFNNKSVSNSPTTSLTYDWRFGDSTTSTSASPVKSYVYDGVKNLTLYVENGEGCRDTFTSKLEVYPQTVVDFAINDVDQCENNNLFQFTGNSATGVRGGYLYSDWKFGDGGKDTSRNTSHRYSAHANHQVKLVITTFYGCKDSITKPITVFKKPTGLYTKITKDSCLNNSHTFKVDDLDATTMTSVLWEFNDGSNYTDSIITRTFALDGQKSASLFIQNSNGCIDSLYPKFNIYDNPIANYTRKDTFLCLEGNNFELTSTATSKYGSINQYKWEFGDVQTASTKSSVHKYSDSGYYDITYRVVNSLGCGDSMTKVVRVNPNPRVHFNADLYQQCWHSNVTQFTDSSESNLVGKPSLVYAWSFGDSLTSASANPQKTYQWYGVKTIQLIATNDEGCSDTVKRSVEIKPEPFAKFKIDNSAQCVNDNKFNFLDTTLTRQRGGSHVVNWKFADGDTSSLKSFSRTKNQVGTLGLKMIATSEFGCQDSIEKTIRVFAKPQAVVKYLSQDSCLSTTARLQAVNAASNGIRTARWSYDDGTGSTGINVTKKYTQTGSRTVILNLENTNYCRDTVEFNYTVRANPKSYFVASKYSLCERGNLVVFKDSSIAAEGQIDSLVWDFNNGVRVGKTGKDTAQYSFGVARVYTVKQVAVNSFGCQDSSTQKVTILANPDADFDIDQSSQCLSGNAFTFTNNTNPNNGNSAMSFFWNFGDSTNSSSKNPKKTYSFDGTKAIRLIASNSDGCLDTIDKSVLVRPQPKAKFAINTVNQCVNAQSYTFTDQSTVKSGGGSLSRVWNLGDGSVSNQTIVNGVNYKSAGLYIVKLTSRTTFNCIDTVVQQIRVFPKPTVAFTVNQDTQCLVGNSYGFNNTSNIATGGGTLTYAWTFGNGSNSSNTHPTLGYNQYGSYAVELKATSSNGCIETLKKNVTVVANPAVNFAFATSDKQCNSVDNFKMTNQTNLLNGRSAKYTWNYGDNTISSANNGNHSYSQDGNYTVKLLALNSNGCRDSISKTLTVYADPVADFSINQAGQCINDQLFDFNNNSSVAFGGGALSQIWKSDDSVISTVQNITATFKEVKTYSIKLVSISSLGCKDSVTKNVVVYPKPQADFAINNAQQCLQNNRFDYTNNSKISSGSLKYVWSYGDASGSTTVSPTKNYSAYGSYTVQLMSISGFGCKDSIVKTVKVHSQPTVQFSLSDTSSCLYQNQFSFTNQSSNADGSNLNHTWLFSDGSSQSSLNSVKSFSNSGRYLVKLRSQSSFGCRDSMVKWVRVYPQPLPSFNLVKANQCLNNNAFEVQNATTVATEGGTLSYVWDFGDGSSSTSKNPKWSFGKADTYTVFMTVKSSFNCIDSLKKVAVVNPEPTVDFNFVKSGIQTAGDTIQCLNTNLFQLNNLANVSSGTLTHQWSFGNGQSSVGLSPQIKYNSDGKYRIRLISITNFGCRDSSFETVSVYPDPDADFNINDVDQCFRGHEFVLTNASKIKSGSLSYDWTLGDGSISSTNNIRKTYNQFGQYSVKLFASSNKGCRDSVSKVVRVYAQPKAAFVTNDSIQCFNNNDYVFENKSSIGFGSLFSLWSFGDANFSTAQLGRHEYKKAGIYNVQLISSSAFGCADTFINSVKVTEIPKISFTMNSSAMCERGNQFVADNSSTYSGIEAVTYIWKLTDGFVDSSAYFNYSFSNSGNFGIKLIGVTTEGCADSISKSVMVYPQGISDVRILDTVQCLYGNDFSFGNDSKITGASFSIMSWNFGDGIIDTAYRTEPISHSYNDTGVYQVELISTTEHLCTDISTGFVRVVPMPVAKLSLNQYGYCFNEQQFELVDVSVKNSTSTNRWIYGNSESDNLDTLRPTFDRVGKYRVRLVEYTNFGCSDTTETMLVVNKIPMARIAVNINEQCLEKNEFLFRNASIDADEPMEFWDFGDGAFGSGNEVNQTYKESGDFEVILVVENDSNCLDTAMLSVRVNPTPEAALLIDPSCEGQPVNIASGSSISEGFINQYEWNMGDGRNYFFEQPEHTYNKPGKYYVTLTMTSDEGCYAKYLDSTNVYANPTAQMATFTQRATILKPQVAFLDSSVDAASYEWDFGDGSDFAFDYEAIHEYADTGLYKTRLVVSSADGCLDTTYANVRVWPDFNILLPTAFSPNGDLSNDAYRIRGNHHSIAIAEWQIYTDDGIKVFESNDITASWDGTFNEQPLPMGNYQLVLIVKDIFGKQAQFNEKISLVR